MYLESLESRRLMSAAFINGNDNDIVRDSAGNEHLAYRDVSTEQLMYSYRPNGGNWQTPTVIDDGGAGNAAVGEYVAINVDLDNRPGVAYYDSTNADLKYSKFNGTSWSTPVAVDSSNIVGYYPSLVFNNARKPFIAYYKKSSGDLRVAVYDSSWTISIVDETSADVGRYPSIAIQASTGRWGISYEDTAAGTFKYALQTSSGFSKITVDTSTVLAGGYTSLAFDPDDNFPTFTYYDANNANLKFARASAIDGSGTWSKSVIAGASNKSGKYSNLWYESNGRARITYFNETEKSIYLLDETTTPGSFNSPELVFSGGGFESESVRVTDIDFTYTWVDYSNGTVLYVNDTSTGATWSNATTSAFAARWQQASTVFTDPADGKSKMWVLGGSSSSSGVSTYRQDVQKSDNGTTWTTANSTAFPARDSATALVFTDPADGVSKMWMLGGMNGSAVSDTVYKSANGSTWTAVSSNLPAVYGHSSAVFPDPSNGNAMTMWVFGGRNSLNLPTSNIYKSTDGIHWTLANALAGFGARIDSVVLSYQGKLWLMGGLDLLFAPKNDVWSSSDGVTWTQMAGGLGQSTPNFGAFSDGSGMVYDGKMWLVIGNRVWFSFNGTGWAESADMAAFSSRAGQSSVTLDSGSGQKMWVLGGRAGSSYVGDAWYSA